MELGKQNNLWDQESALLFSVLFSSCLIFSLLSSFLTASQWVTQKWEGICPWGSFNTEGYWRWMKCLACPSGWSMLWWNSVQLSLQDVVRRYKEKHSTFDQFPEKVAFQLNDTHPTIAVPELMRVLMDENLLGWTKSWEITSKVRLSRAVCVVSNALLLGGMGFATFQDLQ